MTEMEVWPDLVSGLNRTLLVSTTQHLSESITLSLQANDSGSVSSTAVDDGGPAATVSATAPPLAPGAGHGMGGSGAAVIAGAIIASVLRGHALVALQIGAARPSVHGSLNKKY